MIDIAERCTILPTWNQSEDDWHLQRTHGIGGSELSAIAGLNKYNSAIQVYGIKTGQIPHEVIDNEAIRWGKRLERPIAEEYAARTRAAVVAWPVSLQLKSHPWMLANLDFLQVEASDQFPAGEVTDWKKIEPPYGIVAILEVKTAGVASHGSVHEWGTDDEPKSPISYELQLRHYLAVCGLRLGFLVGLLGGHGLAVRKVERDQDYEEWIYETESVFWNAHVIPQIPPDPDGSDSAEDTIKALYPVAVDETFEGGADLDILWSDYLSAKEIAEIAETRRKEMRSKVLAMIGENSYASVFGHPVLSFKNSKEGTYFAEKKFAAENPKLYAQYCSPKPGHRSLRELK